MLKDMGEKKKQYLSTYFSMHKQRLMGDQNGSPYHLMFPVEHYDDGVEEDPQQPHHHQVQGANNEHLMR